MQQDRRNRAGRVREEAAEFASDQPHPEQRDSGDEQRFPSRFAEL
jgi:hypothetical protein